MTLGAVFSSLNDFEFNLIGYLWMFCNCVFTASYILYMRYANSSTVETSSHSSAEVRKLRSITAQRRQSLSKLGVVYYNNYLSIIILLPVCLLRGDLWRLYHLREALLTGSFLLVNLLAGLCGVGLNFASLWCISATSATTYAIVGSLNKVPITILGYWLFNTQLSYPAMIFIAVSVFGSLLHALENIPKRSLP